MADTPPVGQHPLPAVDWGRTCNTCVRLRRRLRQLSAWATDEQLVALQAHLDAHRRQDHV